MKNYKKTLFDLGILACLIRAGQMLEATFPREARSLTPALGKTGICLSATRKRGGE